MTEPTYVPKAKTAIAQRNASIPKDLLLPPSEVEKLPRDLTTIPKTYPHFTDTERQIITSPVRTILANIQSRTWTSETVTRAFLKSAAVAQQLANCLTALLYDSAIARARELDEHLDRTGKTVGPLHGLPVSLKDCFITPPTPSALGLTSWAGESTENVPESVLVGMLRDRGAVVHAKTNVPVAMMMMETDNHVTGPTLNPYNTKCSPGGSSGGESALVAMCGSPLGIGTDIGGSIRIPASFTSLYSLKPSFGRLPTYGARSAIPGNDFIFSVNGPLARDLDSVRLYCEAMLCAPGPWSVDPKCIPLPWRSGPHLTSTPETTGTGGGGGNGGSGERRKLRLAFTPPHDTTIHAHPPVARALALTQRACTAAGHDISTWDPTGQNLVLASVEGAFFSLGGPAIQTHLDQTGELWFPGMSKYASAAAVDSSARAEGELEGVLTAEGLREMNLQRNAQQKAHLDRWEKSGVDAIVAPVSPWSAVRSGLTTRERGRSYIGFTAIWSLLDVSVGTVPVTIASEEDGWEKVGGRPEAFGVTDERVMSDWNGEVYEGTPVGLQVICGRLEEEKVLEVVGEVGRAVREFGGKEVVA